VYLLDTMVVSETFKRAPSAGAMAQLSTASSERRYIGALTLGELERGLAKVRLVDDRYAARLARWIEVTEQSFGDRILPVDVAVAKEWGALAHRLGHATVDSLIAATALVHDLTVVTRNTRHFERTGARTLDPYATPA
jgi:hypothetical protein